MNERIEDIHTVEEYLIYLNEQVEREKKLFDIGGSGMKIKVTKELTLLELLQKFDAGEVPIGKYKTDYGNWVSFGVNREIKFSQNNFLNHRLSDVYEVEVEEEITEDTEFDTLIEILDDEIFDETASIYRNGTSIRSAKGSRTKKIYALIDGDLQLIWERE